MRDMHSCSSNGNDEMRWDRGDSNRDNDNNKYSKNYYDDDDDDTDGTIIIK